MVRNGITERALRVLPAWVIEILEPSFCTVLELYLFKTTKKPELPCDSCLLLHRSYWFVSLIHLANALNAPPHVISFWGSYRPNTESKQHKVRRVPLLLLHTSIRR
jgi:hypothetical protein